MKKVSLFFLVFCVYLTACQHNRSGPPAPAEKSSAPLEGTVWLLTRLGGADVDSAKIKIEPSLTFSADKRISGTGGCNRMVGSYQLEGDKMTFSQMASTKMACFEGTDVDVPLAQALEKARTFKIEGQNLILRDEKGTPVAEFKAK